MIQKTDPRYGKCEGCIEEGNQEMALLCSECIRNNHHKDFFQLKDPKDEEIKKLKAAMKLFLELDEGSYDSAPLRDEVNSLQEKFKPLL